MASETLYLARQDGGQVRVASPLIATLQGEDDQRSPSFSEQNAISFRPSAPEGRAELEALLASSTLAEQRAVVALLQSTHSRRPLRDDEWIQCREAFPALSRRLDQAVGFRRRRGSVPSSPVQSPPRPTHSPPTRPARSSEPHVGGPRRRIELRMYSNWGDLDWIGLSEIRVLDCHDHPIPLACPIQLRPGQRGPSGQALRAARDRLPRLCNGSIETTEAGGMWACRLDPEAGSPGSGPWMTLVLWLEKEARQAASVGQGGEEMEADDRTERGQLVVWNWNGPPRSLGCGCSTADVRCDGKIVWSGQLQASTGRIRGNHATYIPLQFPAGGHFDEASAKGSLEGNDDDDDDEDRCDSEASDEDSDVGIAHGEFENGEEGDLGSRGLGVSVDDPIPAYWSSPQREAPSSSSAGPSSDVTQSFRPLPMSQWKPPPAGVSGRLRAEGEDLLASWRSLDLFAKLHRGRIPAEGDVTEETSFDAQTAPTVANRTTSGGVGRGIDVDFGVEEEDEDDMVVMGTKHRAAVPETSEDRPFTATSALDELLADTAEALQSSPQRTWDQTIQTRQSGFRVDRERRDAPEPLADTSLEASMCDIPVLPSGSKLQLEIWSTWGDPHYVGLAGIDLFDAEGRPIRPTSRVQVHEGDSVRWVDMRPTAQPPGVSTLESGTPSITSIGASPVDTQSQPEFLHDPRRVINLLDGINFTRDDLHVWLAPFHKRLVPVTVEIMLDKPMTLSLLRIWNLNTSRIHSYRGARRVRVLLDEAEIFFGELRKAPGDFRDPTDASEVILFTMDDSILAHIEQFDDASSTTSTGVRDAPGHAIVEWVRRAREEHRPRTAETPITAGNGRLTNAGSRLQRPARAPSPVLAFGDVVDEVEDAPLRPAAAMTPSWDGGQEQSATAAERETSTEAGEKSTADAPLQAWLRSWPAECLREGGLGAHGVWSRYIRGRSLRFDWLDTHGDPHYLGVTNVAVVVVRPDDSVDEQGSNPGSRVKGTMEKLQIPPERVFGYPRDINVCGHHGDVRTLDKLVDGVGRTVDESHMWLVPFNPGGSHIVELDLGQEWRIRGVIIHNYNKSSTDTTRGARLFRMWVDNNSVSGVCDRHVDPPDASVHWLREAPGIEWAAGGQWFPFSTQGNKYVAGANEIEPHYVPPLEPPTEEEALKRFMTAISSHIGRPLFRPVGYSPPPWPVGHRVRLVLHDSCGDPFYLGVDDIALWDPLGVRIPVAPRQLRAWPVSVDWMLQDEERGTATAAVAEQMVTGARDVRVLENLAYRRGDEAPRRAWLAPKASSLEPDTWNEVHFSLDQPVCLGGVSVWNYSKTPSRGVSTMSVWMDRTLLWMGQLRPCGAPGQGSAVQTILFATAKQGSAAIHQASQLPPQSVVCIDEQCRVDDGGRPESHQARKQAVAARPVTAMLAW